MLGRVLAALLIRLGVQKRPDFRVRWVRDMPAKTDLRPGELVVVGERRSPKWATMPCPSGCGTPLLLSLGWSRRPRWSVVTDGWGRPTLSPSVRRTDGCRCHFWLRRGVVEWCADTGKA